MKILPAILISLLPNSHPQKSFADFTRQFITSYQALPIPALQLSYADDLKNIEPKDTIEKEITFFTRIKDGLKNYRPEKLSETEQQDYLQIEYETTINLERLNLELHWLGAHPNKIPDDNIAAIPD